MPSRRTRIALTALAALSVLVVALWHGQGSWNHAKRLRDATGSSPGLGALVSRSVFLLKKGDEACLSPVTFYGDTARARFRVQAPRAPGPRIRFTASGAGYRASATTATLPPETEGLVDIEFAPPGRRVTGRFCWRNVGPTPVNLIGTNEGRSLTPATATVNGREREDEEIELVLMERGGHSLRERRSELVERAAALTGGLAPEWLLWPAAFLIFGSPLLVAAAFALSVWRDQRSGGSSSGPGPRSSTTAE